MVAVFGELLGSEDWGEVAGTLTGRSVPEARSSAERHEELSPQEAVAVGQESPVLLELLDGWEEHKFSMSLLTLLSSFDVERASRPPVVEVTVTPPAGMPAPPPGTYRMQTGPHPVVSYTPPQDPESDAEQKKDDLPPAPRFRLLGTITGRLGHPASHATG